MHGPHGAGGPILLGPCLLRGIVSTYDRNQRIPTSVRTARFCAFRCESPSRVQGDEDWKPATANRYRALMSLMFKLGIQSGKVNSNEQEDKQDRFNSISRTARKEGTA